MLKVRPDMLVNLTCSLCEGYLKVSPVMVKADKRQICGKCFKILPINEKQECVRQVGYETLAETFLFPCRYSFHGCQSEFPINGADNHELECPFRFNALDCIGERSEDEHQDPTLFRNMAYVSDGNVLVHNEKPIAYTCSPANSFTAFDTTDCISVQSKYTFKQNNISEIPEILQYKSNIFYDENKAGYLRNSPRLIGFIDHHNNNPVDIAIEGAISLKPFRNIFCKVRINQPQEHEYETIKDNHVPSSHYPKCVKCPNVLKNAIYHCPFGHDVCTNCKGSACPLCTSPINSVPIYYCSNFSKGCHVYLLYSEQYLHSKDCEFSEFKCILHQQCGEMLETLSSLKQHIKDKHLPSIVLSNHTVKRSSNKDELWIMFAFDSLFKCKRFSYETETEFLVQFVGPCNQASNFKYEICIKSENDEYVKLTKNATCVAWNTSPLDPGLMITKMELQARKMAVNFMYILNILKI